MANQFKSGKEAAGYLFDVAVRKGKAAAQREYERLVDSIPRDQSDDFLNSINNINRQKNISEDKGLGDAKVQRYREKAAKNMPVDYETEFAPKPQPKAPSKATQAPPAAPKPAAKEVAKPTPKPTQESSVSPEELAFRKKMAAMKEKALSDQRAREKAGTPPPPMSGLLNIKADTPAPNSRPTIGGSTLQMPKFVPKK